MHYLSLCSGIEAATVAWEPLGWQPTAFAEFDKFPSAVLDHHYPNTPNLGDITKINGKKYRNEADLIVGGTPCQSFSIAGLRGGLDDERGNLAFEFCRLVREVRPVWFVWENVPGVLSSNGGRDFGSILGAMADIGYGVCWRVLDAQFFGVPQRRRRVFVIGYLGDWRPAGAVLFEPESLRGDSTASREKGKEVTGNTGPGFTADPSPTLTGGDRHAVALTSQAGSKVLKIRSGCDGGGKGALVGEEQSFTLATSQDQTLFPRGSTRVRRLTPTECERLQGFPDGYTRIPYRGKPAENCPDGPRYKAIGNSMAVPVMRWIGERIQKFEERLEP